MKGRRETKNMVRSAEDQDLHLWGSEEPLAFSAEEQKSRDVCSVSVHLYRGLFLYQDGCFELVGIL